MPGGRFSKQGDWFSQKLNAANANDSQIGGALSVAPSGSNLGGQQFQTLPGDRVIFSPADALAMQNNNTSNLYTGTYRYVATANSTSSPTRGHGAFWVPVAFNNNQAVQDGLYQVTSDEQANYGVSLFAGVFLNSPGKLAYWWIQESGKVAAQFATTISAPTPAIGKGVYLLAGGNNNNAVDVGSFDQIFGLNAGTTFSAANTTTAYNAIDNAFVRYVGVAEQLPSNNNISVIDIQPRFARW
jgi:hypothetical protein